MLYKQKYIIYICIYLPYNIINIYKIIIIYDMIMYIFTITCSLKKPFGK